MSLRVKKTLRTLLRGVILMAAFTVIGLSKPHTHLALNLPFVLFCLFWTAITVQTWWLYGDSEKAVAQRARLDEKRAARRAHRRPSAGAGTLPDARPLRADGVVAKPDRIPTPGGLGGEANQEAAPGEDRE